MYILEVIIDGFKSYAARTVVSGFDPHFNAITGLNGTGKSNILDSICFVLGISNLSQVRVGNLQELVYKQGQAGVTKATVTIVFDNSDTSTSPVGYEHLKQITVSRQIVIGGKNKYMINGHTVQQSQVQNLFHSVSLNVNNPHFLIMQGRITKVLNMKPPEILSMIEEAAGTRMFETKKQAALKTIEKKQQKVDEITRVIDSDIDPKLSQLRGERQNYLDWSSNNTEVERLERFCVAATYQDAEQRVQNAEGERAALQAELDELEQQKASFETEVSDCKQRISVLEAEKEAMNDGEGGLQELKKTEQDLSKELVKVNTTWKNEQDSLTTERENLASMEKQIEQNKVLIEQKKVEIATLAEEYTQAEQSVKQGEEHLATVREAYQNACAGKAETSNAELLSLPEQIGAWEKSAREAESALQQGTLRVKHANDQLKELKKSVKSQQSAHTAMTKEIDTLRTTVATVEAKIVKLNYSATEDAAARAKQSSLQDSVSSLKDHVEELSAQLEARLRFDYTAPESGFDSKRVKGMVAKLFQVPDDIHATALEVTAGGKLFQVVVDSEQTGKLLLQHGKLRKRATFIPLNKISSRTVDNAKMAAARRIASENGCNAYLAIELIRFDEEMRKGMEYIFGNTIICDNPKIAELIAFDRNIRVRTVTLEGDVYDPSGTVTGGARNNLGVLLGRMTDLNKSQSALKTQTRELSDLDRLVEKFERDAQAFDRLSAELDGKQRALQNGEERLAATTFSVMTGEIETLEAEIQKCKEDETPLKEAVAHAKSELTRLQATDSTIKKRREEAMKSMQDQVSKAQKALTDLKSKALGVKNKRERAIGELQSLEAEISTLQEQLTAGERALNKISAEVAALEQAVSAKREEYDDAKAAVQAAQAETQRQSKEIRQLCSQSDKADKEAKACSLQARKQQHTLENFVKEVKDSERRVKDMVKKYPWIVTEKQSFGVAGSGYDFGAQDVDASHKRLSDLKSQQDKLSKKVNKKVMGMIEKAETENEELKRKREVILKDKSKIEKVIDELDVKKNQALQTTWIKVNRDFGSIFSTLLPGTSAKLEPLEGCTVSDGLEVKVAFNSVWKDSLTELSGGQRSLLALSLILALLLFKPAPMYILDEVDAALDLSHTQNIGLMLRTHFSASQFIVVSLKEGMFNNANVIFRTRFVDGISAVTRTVAGGKKNMITSGADESEPADAPTKKKGMRTGNMKN